ncbi:SAM-dependent methyltransferase [Pseudomonas sp. GD03860]|uniref:methyltransferase n=1 Tax=Pseudomonas TaxID=286 RepID=UPI0023640158|nr:MULTISPECIES: methyltransferase [Pseudomonas]MDD2059363.1 SAM-dependent methyltransferase [Pseudomonas putida]MDH0636690.1 SAM-dependent methyltransferase [Pseudomonas sp. GD03860]
MTTALPLANDQLLSRFQALDSFLREHQHLWRPRPFTQLHLPWEAKHPALATWLRGRSLTEAEAAHNHPQQLDAPAPFPQLASMAARLTEVGELSTVALPAAGHRLNVDVPGRKWQQIEAFASHLDLADVPRHWLDWCSGKGHLGRRLLQADSQQLTCLEYDPALVEAGRQLSEHHGLNAEHVLQDVLAEDATLRLDNTHTAVALHACGDLHVRLMQVASRQGCRQLAIAPCCYNRIQATQYQPLSAAAIASNLQLSIDDLGLPLSETVTAGARVRRQRDESMARRLGFDWLQRELRGMDEYLPTPSLPVSWLQKPYADYCRELAALKGLSIDHTADWDALQAKGWQRLAEVRNLELLRNLFRRPLELWLVLDRALYLQEQGYHVRLGVFCEQPLTPRNLMLLAERR